MDDGTSATARLAGLLLLTLGTRTGLEVVAETECDVVPADDRLPYTLGNERCSSR